MVIFFCLTKYLNHGKVNFSVCNSWAKNSTFSIMFNFFSFIFNYFLFFLNIFSCVFNSFSFQLKFLSVSLKILDFILNCLAVISLCWSNRWGCLCNYWWWSNTWRSISNSFCCNFLLLFNFHLSLLLSLLPRRYDGLLCIKIGCRIQNTFLSRLRSSVIMWKCLFYFCFNRCTLCKCCHNCNWFNFSIMQFLQLVCFLF